MPSEDKAIQVGCIHSYASECIACNGTAAEVQTDIPDRVHTAVLQTEFIFRPATYEAEIFLLLAKIRKLTIEVDSLKKCSFNFDTVIVDEDLCQHYTGLRSAVVILLAELSGVFTGKL